MKVEQDGDMWVVCDWCMTDRGWLYAGIEWFNTKQEALNFVYKSNSSDGE